MPELDLWLDPQGVKPRAFVSHAHADHFARHESILCSSATATLLKHRFNVADERLDATSFHMPVAIGDFRLRLLPAGHIPGSAMLHITRTTDNATLLYTGDFKTRRSRITEAAHFLTADTLVMETTFGLPHYEFPTPMEVEAQLLRFVHDSLTDGDTPVLLAYSLGKTQEAIALLAENQIPTVLHPAAAKMTAACRLAGVEGLPDPLEFSGEVPAGHVLITPPNALKTKAFKGIPSKRTAMLSGWALQPNARFRYGVDEMIPLSDHADHPGLMECVQRVRPRRVLTVHGYTKEFAAHLRDKQIDAWCAAGGDQLELPIHRPARRQATSARAGWHNRALCPLADFTDLCRLLGKTGSQVSKVDFIANYFSNLESDEELACAAEWLCAPPQSRLKSPLNANTLRLALSAIPGVREERYHELRQSHGDDVTAAGMLLQELPLQPEGLTLVQTAEFISAFDQSTSSMDHLQKLRRRLTTLHPAESETILRLIIRKLRLGIDRGLVEEAMAKAFNADPADIRRSAKATGRPGTTAILAKHGNLGDATAHAGPSNSGSPTGPPSDELPLD